MHALGGGGGVELVREEVEARLGLGLGGWVD